MTNHTQPKHKPSITVHTSAPAKLIIFGEHAVVFGKSAIATSLNLRTHSTLKLKKPLFSFGNLENETISSVIDEIKRSITHIHEVNTNDCISVQIFGKQYHFPISHVLEHFIHNWAHFRSYFKRKEELIFSDEPGKPRPRTVDDDLVRKVEEMLLTCEVVDPNAKSPLSFIRSPKKSKPGSTWNYHEKASLICIFYCYYVGLFHWIKYQDSISDVDSDSFDSTWIKFTEKSVAIAKEVSHMIFDLKIDTELPVGAGLGSSASFAVSIASAFMTWFKENFTLSSVGFDNTKLENINDLSYELECIIHGTPSGIDNTVSTYGGMILMEGKKKVTPMTWEHEKLRVIIVNTSVPRNTKDLVAGVRMRYENPESHEYMEEIMDSIDKISNRFVDMIKNGFSRKKFEKLIDKNQQLLNEMGVGHTQLSKIVFEGKKYDLHGKLTGAGGGGCAFVYIPPLASDDLVKQFMNDLEFSGFWCKEVEISSPGVNIELIQEKVEETPKKSLITNEKIPTQENTSPKTISPVSWGSLIVWGSVATLCVAASSMLIRYRLKK